MVSLPPSQSNRQPFLDQANAIRATNPIDRLPTTQDIFAAAVYEHLWMKDGFEHLTAEDREDFVAAIKYKAALVAQAGVGAEEVAATLQLALAPINTALDSLTAQFGALQHQLDSNTATLDIIQWTQAILPTQLRNQRARRLMRFGGNFLLKPIPNMGGGTFPPNFQPIKSLNDLNGLSRDDLGVWLQFYGHGQPDSLEERRRLLLRFFSL